MDLSVVALSKQQLGLPVDFLAYLSTIEW